VVSLWSGRAALDTAMGPDLEESRFHPEYLPETADRIVEVMTLELALTVNATPGVGGRPLRVDHSNVSFGAG
jgi:hypothetical protein